MTSFDMEKIINIIIEHKFKLEEISSRTVKIYSDLLSIIETNQLQIQQLEKEVHSLKCDGKLIREQVGDKFHYRCPKCNKHIKIIS